ncbi:MAG TPA: putative oxidoreductase C-terminal domain-containing protein [Bryobacteraceae bacterium]|nr:putative oxidoreductase C-terminal domain-containing protein [Bryobacteraceae bacterium]
MSQESDTPVRLMIVEPGHFHASLLQRDMYPSIAPKVAVYAPLGPELIDYLNRISLFNRRAEKPTSWELDVSTSSDPMLDMLKERPGNVVLFTGKNLGKIDRINASLDAGLHVFADKPWIISSKDMAKLDHALETAERKGLAAYDIMTERFEVTSELQRIFVNTPEVFGKLEHGSAADPAIYAKSIHHVMKIVAGVPLKRPAWFFDTDVYGEGLADVGTHVVDLVQWTAFPDQALDYRKDVQVLEGKHWPLKMTKEQFQQVTGEPLAAEKLDYYCNNSVHYTLRGVHVKLDILWNWEAPAGAGDLYEATFRGSNARIEIRQGKLPELYIVPTRGRAGVFAAVKNKINQLQTQFPGVTFNEQNGRITIPEKFHVGHEAHFAQVANRFFSYIASPKSMPSWERPNMLVKYFISTKGVELAQK